MPASHLLFAAIASTALLSLLEALKPYLEFTLLATAVVVALVVLMTRLEEMRLSRIKRIRAEIEAQDDDRIVLRVNDIETEHDRRP